MVTIFIVEDDPLIKRLYGSAFKLYGYAIDTASDGAEALAKLAAAKEKPTLVLLDVMMPKMNGMDVLKKMKESPALKSIPVVMLTNLAGENDAKTAVALGAVAYLVKSQHEPKEIIGKIKELLEAATKAE